MCTKIQSSWIADLILQFTIYIEWSVCEREYIVYTFRLERCHTSLTLLLVGWMLESKCLSEYLEKIYGGNHLLGKKYEN
jgi:hypothetical protein